MKALEQVLEELRWRLKNARLRLQDTHSKMPGSYSEGIERGCFLELSDIMEWVSGKETTVKTAELPDFHKIIDALEIAATYGQYDGAHHKMWVIDQMVRVLAGNNYDKWRSKFIEIDGDEHVDMWDTGIAP